MKKVILLFAMVTSVMLFNMADVEAADYTITDFSQEGIAAFVGANQDNPAFDYTTTSGVYVLTLTEDDTLTIGSEAFVGASEDYYLQMGKDTTMRVALDTVSSAITVYVDEGVASTTDREDYVFYTRKSISYGNNTDPEYWYDDVTYPMNFVVASGATFNIRCPFIVTATTLDGNGTDLDPSEDVNPATVTNEGTVNVASTMTVEDGAEAGLTGEFTLVDGAQIIASTDISEHIANEDVVYDAVNGTYATRADYTEVDAAIREADALVETDYTEESWALLQDALNAVDRTLASTEQTTVNGYAAAIRTAIDNLDPAISVGEPDDSEGNLGDSEVPTTPSEDDVTTPEETPEVPQTYDGVVVSAIVGAGALAVVVTAVILAKKKILFN